MQMAMDVHKISDLEEQPAPNGCSWWCVDGIWYEWRKGSPTLRITTRSPGPGGVPDEIVSLDSPTKAAAKRAVFRDVWPDR